MLLILMLKRAGNRMLPCGTPVSCLCSSERVEPTLTPETEIPEVRQNAVLPCSVVSFLKVKENG